MRNDQILAFQSFEATIPGDLVAEWRAAVELWESHSNAPNPFKVEKQRKQCSPLNARNVNADVALNSYFGAAGSATARTRG
jgi:hypothetical protein